MWRHTHVFIRSWSLKVQTLKKKKKHEKIQFIHNVWRHMAAHLKSRCKKLLCHALSPLQTWRRKKMVGLAVNQEKMNYWFIIKVVYFGGRCQTFTGCSFSTVRVWVFDFGRHLNSHRTVCLRQMWVTFVIIFISQTSWLINELRE